MATELGPSSALSSTLHASFYPLHAAVAAGDLAKVHTLLEGGQDVNQIDYQGVTALALGAAAGRAELVQALLDAKANVAIASRTGATALSVAQSGAQSAVVALLQAAGASEAATKQPLPAYNPKSQDALNAACEMEPGEVAAMQAAWALLTSANKPQDTAGVVSATGVAFFTLLFQEHPSLLQLFSFRKPNAAAGVDAKAMEAHSVRVLTTLGKVLELLDDFETLAGVASGLVRRHIGYGVKLEHYDQVLGCFATFLSTALTNMGLWDALQASAWTKLVALVKAVAASQYQTAKEP